MFILYNLKIIQCYQSNQYQSTIAEEIKKSPGKPVEEIVVDTKLSTMKPIHANTMKKSYEFFKSPEGKKIIKSGRRATGITEAFRRSVFMTVRFFNDHFYKFID